VFSPFHNWGKLFCIYNSVWLITTVNLITKIEEEQEGVFTYGQ